MKSSFDFAAVEDFDDHIRRSIPQIEEMYRLCHAVTNAFAQEGTIVTDLGCSTGKFLLDTPKRKGVTYHGIDRCDWKDGRGWADQVMFHNLDIVETVREGWMEGTSVILSLFTIQFLPYKDRVEVIERCAEGLVDGGAMIVAEKVHLADQGLSEVIERDLIEWKRGNFDDASILNKSAQLAGSMRLRSQGDMFHLMQKHFNTVNVIWAHGQFICMVGVKAESTTKARRA